MTVPQTRQRGNAIEGGACSRVERPTRGSKDAPAVGLASGCSERTTSSSSQKPGELGPGDSGDEPGPPYRVSSKSPRGEKLALLYGNSREGCSKTFLKLLLHLIFLEANEVIRLLFCALETGK